MSNDSIIAVGGGKYNDEKEPSLKRCVELKRDADSNWFTVPHESCTAPRFNHGMCALDPLHVVVTGSWYSSCSDSAEIFDLTEDAWFDLPKLNKPRHCHGTCAIKGKYVYVFAGMLKPNGVSGAGEEMNCIEFLEFNGAEAAGAWTEVNTSQIQSFAPR